MNRTIVWILALSLLVLSCAPGSQVIPAGPGTPVPQKQEVQPAITPLPLKTPAPSITPVITPPPVKTPVSAGAPVTAPKGEQAVSLRERSIGSARSVLEQDSTFRFDGIRESVKLAGEKALEEGKIWEFYYTFESRYPGYGDRSGRIMAAVITPHKVRIVVRGGTVTEALMDEQWDMLGQRMIGRKAN